MVMLLTRRGTKRLAASGEAATDRSERASRPSARLWWQPPAAHWDAWLASGRRQMRLVCDSTPRPKPSLPPLLHKS